jgi:predicted small secreted protein
MSFLALFLLLSLLFTGCATAPGTEEDAASGSESEAITEAETLYPSHIDSIDAAVVPGELDGTEENGFILSDLSVSADKRFYVIPSQSAAPTAEDWAAVRALARAVCWAVRLEMVPMARTPYLWFAT